jgi:hypothetical protein
VVGGQRHVPAAIPQERHGTPCIGGWVGHRAALEGCGKSCPTGIRSPNHLDRSESLYWLSLPGPRQMNVDIQNDPIKPSKCRFYKLCIIVVGRERNADFSATNGGTISVRIVSKSFKLFLFQVHVPMAEVLISSSFLSRITMHSQAWSVSL